jgi:hypothetical protein
MPASNGLTPAERSTRASLASHASWAKTENRTARTQPGREAILEKYFDQVDPECKLTPEERRKRAANAHKAELQRLALKSAKARRQAQEDRAQERADLAEAKLAGYIERMLAEAPPLTDEQRTRLAELLRPVR